MKKKLHYKVSTLFVLFTLVFSANQTFGQIVLTQETAAQYVEKIVGNNVEWSNAVIIGSADAIASFTGGESGGLPNTMESGVMLSTGSLASSDAMAGPAIIFSSTDMETDGIAELTAMTGMQTYDGIILQFDIVPATDQLIINYQFGSEEYNTWVNTPYTDQMAIFISGPGFDASGENIATGPNGTLINSNTINRGRGCVASYTTVATPNSPCPMESYHCATNPMYYIDNCTGISNVMNGFTLMLSAIAPYVIPNETYTIRIMIADVEDAEYDSWVILQENGIYSGSEEASTPVFDEDSFTAYPNPVRDIFTISYNTQVTGVEVTNMLGQTVISKTTNSNDVHIDMSALPMGNYLVKVKANEMNKTLKVIKQ